MRRLSLGWMSLGWLSRGARDVLNSTYLTTVICLLRADDEMNIDYRHESLRDVYGDISWELKEFLRVFLPFLPYACSHLNLEFFCIYASKNGGTSYSRRILVLTTSRKQISLPAPSPHIRGHRDIVKHEASSTVDAVERPSPIAYLEKKAGCRVGTPSVAPA